MQLFISWEGGQNYYVAQMEHSVLVPGGQVCATVSVYSPALSQSVVAEMQNELVKRIWLLSDLLLFLFLHFGLRFLDKPMRVKYWSWAK